MPVYEYACSNCQNVFEKWLKVSEITETAFCPKCGNQAQHIISNTAFVLKGGGWYVTDYGYRKGASDTETPSATPTADLSPQSENPTPAAAAPDQPPSSATNDASA